VPDLTTAKALREQRHALVQRARKEILEPAEAAGRDLTAEEQEHWTTIMGGTRPDGTVVRGEVDVLMDRITRLEQVEREDAHARAPAGLPDVGRGALAVARPGDGAAAVATDAHRALALQAWVRTQVHQDLDNEHLEACRLVGLNPARPVLALRLLDTHAHADLRARFAASHPSRARQNLAEYRAALSTGSGPAGGYLVPPETLIRQLEINMLAYGGVRQVAESIRTASGERLSWPTADDTTNTGAQLGESTTIGSSVEPSFAKVFWDAYKFSSKPILVPYELIQDSAFNLPQILGEMLGERLGRITNTKFTTGTGAATPKGIVTASTAGKTTASATAIAADEIIDLVHSIDPAYRAGAGFMMHDGILQAIRKLKDGQGRYLMDFGLAMGMPDRLLGYAVTINQDMQATVATGTKTMLFGLLSHYKVRTVGEVRLYRLQERYRDTDQDAFIAFCREDGNLLTAGTVPVKHLLQA